MTDPHDKDYRPMTEKEAAVEHVAVALAAHHGHPDGYAPSDGPGYEVPVWMHFEQAAQEVLAALTALGFGPAIHADVQGAMIDALAEEIEHLRADVARAHDERDEAMRAAVLAVTPLEALAMSGGIDVHCAELQGGIREGIAAVRALVSKDTAMPDRTDAIARAICAETCAFMGEPPCYQMTDYRGNPVPWPNPRCDDPGCHALAVAAVVAMERENRDD